MKTLGVVLLVAACFVATTHSFPGARDSDSNEKSDVDTLLVLPPEDRERLILPLGLPQLDFDDSDENPSWNWPTLGRPNFMDGWYTSIQDQMKRLRDQMAGILSHVIEQGGTTWGKLPEGANTTSVTKIIDGHKVTINETTYMDGDDVHGTLIRVRVIDVNPQNDTTVQAVSDGSEESEGTEATTIVPTSMSTSTSTSTATTASKNENTTASRSVETVEEFDNEISKNQEDNLTA